jgi:nicotinate-nucleotide pyrophosphorylase (carboxylating)
MSEALDIDRIEGLLELALSEDVGPRDLTTEAVVPAEARASGAFVARQAGVLAGGPVVEAVYQRLSSALAVRFSRREGEAFSPNDVLGEVRGVAGPILTGERVALNFLQRLSGVATRTRQYVEAVRAHGVEVFDTRKTTPGWRYLEKYAVRMGGGRNHRMGLYDQVLIKDNHIACVRPLGLLAELGPLIREARRQTPAGTVIEVEVASLEQLLQALAGEPDILLLDNMSVETLKRAVTLVGERVPKGKRPILEASGGVTLATAALIAATGVDRISVGELTHSAPAIDIALELTVE